VAIRSVPRDIGERYALNEPSTDEQPWPLRRGLLGPVARPAISLSRLLVVPAQNGTEPRPLTKCRYFRVLRHVCIVPLASGTD
jgi:hypothetical protein